MSIVLPCLVSDIQYPISNIQYPISNIQYPVFIILHLSSNVVLCFVFALSQSLSFFFQTGNIHSKLPAQSLAYPAVLLSLLSSSPHVKSTLPLTTSLLLFSFSFGILTLCHLVVWLETLLSFSVITLIR
ncbi:hypothetical protein EDC96DRAFT_105190 [Choanephora cucurbitarum]|nr:hypothetical protein EDC96DRAFT_105190 [Choanephora cucurbitarum]